MARHQVESNKPRLGMTTTETETVGQPAREPIGAGSPSSAALRRSGLIRLAIAILLAGALTAGADRSPMGATEREDGNHRLSDLPGLQPEQLRSRVLSHGRVVPDRRVVDLSRSDEDRASHRTRGASLTGSPTTDRYPN